MRRRPADAAFRAAGKGNTERWKNCESPGRLRLLFQPVEDVLVVSEESGISPRSIALGLECMYPGIADAARRLHTRIDVEWLRLI